MPLYPHTYKQDPIKLFHNIALFYICLFLYNKHSLTNCLILNHVLCIKFHYSIFLISQNTVRTQKFHMDSEAAVLKLF